MVLLGIGCPIMSLSDPKSKHVHGVGYVPSEVSWLIQLSSVTKLSLRYLN